MVFKISNDATLSFFLKIFFGMFFKLFGVSFHIIVHMGFFNFIQGPLGVPFLQALTLLCVLDITVIYYTVMPTNQ